MAKEPKTLQDAIKYFSEPANVREYLEVRRWPDGVRRCPRCGSDAVIFQEKYNRYQCGKKHDRRQFTLKTGTIFEDSPIGLDKWLMAMWMVVNCKNGVSSYEIARAIGVTQKSAWFMDHRIRFALHQQAPTDKMGGEDSTVEVDETYIGGLARNMHKNKRVQGRTGGAGKLAVFGLLERSKEKGKSKVRTHVVPTNWNEDVQMIIKETVAPKTNVYSDEHGTYHHLGSAGFQHAFVRHAEYYVDGAVHANGIENFWSLLKRGIKGTYVSVEPFHMFRYLDEQCFRFNERFNDDGARFDIVVRNILDKRLTYANLTGKDDRLPETTN
jgi:ribosomal protein S27AE/transposase-like protein